jgi:hypothetical protein
MAKPSKAFNVSAKARQLLHELKKNGNLPVAKALDQLSGGAASYNRGQLNCRLRPRLHLIEQRMMW